MRDRTRLGRAIAAALRWAGLGLLLGVSGCADLPWFWLGPDDATDVAAADQYGLGKMHLAAGRAGLAVRHFQTAVDQVPDSPDALNGLAAAYDSLGRHDLAARSYARALALDPGSAETLNNIGYSYLQQRRFDLAVAFLRDAHRRDPDIPVVLENRRTAEASLARAGGPAPRHPVTAAAIEPDGPIRAAGPVLVRSGRAVQTLITRPQVGNARRHRGSVSDLPGYVRASLANRSGAGARTVLPTYLASPMRAADRRWTERRQP